MFSGRMSKSGGTMDIRPCRLNGTSGTYDLGCGFPSILRRRGARQKEKGRRK